MVVSGKVVTFLFTETTTYVCAQRVIKLVENCHYLQAIYYILGSNVASHLAHPGIVVAVVGSGKHVQSIGIVRLQKRECLCRIGPVNLRHDTISRSSR